MSALEVLDYEWGQIFSGTREVLVSAGLVDPAQFPGDPGNNKFTLKYQAGAALVVSVRKISRDRFEVSRDYADEASRQAGLARLAEAERATNIRDHQARAKLPSLPYGYCSWLIARLAQRYPGIEIRDVCAHPWGDAIQQQVKFCASAAQLMDSGLLTQKMIEGEWGKRRNYRATTPVGDAYLLLGDSEAAELWVYTETHPRLEVGSVRDAERELRRFTLNRSKARARV